MYNDLAFAPFGEPYAQVGSTDVSFTGQNQDTVSNLYDFMYREYGIQGRWPSPDPAGTATANPADPQSWNRYAYALNNPLLFVDPLGLDDCLLGGETEDTEANNASDCNNDGGTWITSNSTVTVNGTPDNPVDPVFPLIFTGQLTPSGPVGGAPILSNPLTLNSHATHEMLTVVPLVSS